MSVDINPQHCRFARSQCSAETTSITHEDSISFLNRLSDQRPASIDLLYLDSSDVDWENPHESALHHLNELCAARAALKSGALVVVDDHQDEQGRPGKSLYVIQHMRSIGAKCLFEEYQIGWTL